jgi:small subunit ribosomal protein S4
MIIKSKYKIARKVGAPIFEKTQTAKYAQRQENRGKAKGRGPRQKSDYGVQLNEKQKARYTYLLAEHQFANYVKKATAKKRQHNRLALQLA